MCQVPSMAGSNSPADRDPWLEPHLGRRAYRIEGGPFLELVSSDRLRFMENVRHEKAFAYWKIPVSNIEALHIAEGLGFRLIDTLVKFEKPIRSASTLSGKCLTRAAQPADESRVAEIARSAFTFSRFHLDPHLSIDIANRIKEDWVRNYFRGKRGEAMLVALQGNRPEGFVQLLIKNQVLTIDLIAVSPQLGQRGIGTSLIQGAEAVYEDCKTICVGTQLANVPSIRFYEKSGFRVKTSSHVLHFHGWLT